jgi:hypothetical protein
MVNIMALTFFVSLIYIPKMQSFTFWKFFGLSISVDMDQKTIEKTQPTLDLMNENVQHHFQFNVYTHDLDVVEITIYHKAYTRLMGHSHMVSMTQNPFLICIVMFHTYDKHWRTTYGPN